VLAEIALFFFLRGQLGSITVALFAWCFVAGMSAYLIYWLAVRYFVGLLHAK